MNLENLLETFGLNQTEAKIYLVALKKESMTATEIAQLTNLKRPTTYYTLQQLEKKGLISILSGKTGAEKFKAEPPEQLLSLLAREKNQLSHLEKNLSASLPFFPTQESMTSANPRVSFYRGFEGLKNLSEKVFKSKNKELFSFMPSFKKIETASVGEKAYMQFYLEERAKNNILTKSIWVDAPNEKIFRNNKKNLRTVRIAPKTMKYFDAMVDIFDNHVIFTVSLPEIFGVDIESHALSRSMLMIWQAIWNISKPLK